MVELNDSFMMSKRYARSRSPSGSGPSPLAHLAILAHEANLVRNQDALAHSVEYSAQTCSTSDLKGKGKTRMIRWVPQDSTAWAEDDSPFPVGKVTGNVDEGGYWVDRLVLRSESSSPTVIHEKLFCLLNRFDILNLLTTLPSPPSHPPSPALSAGFSDLGSDHEEMFFFDQQTQEDITNRKKRRRLEHTREERIRRLEEEDRAAKGDDDDEGDEVSLPFGSVIDTARSQPSAAV